MSDELTAELSSLLDALQGSVPLYMERLSEGEFEAHAILFTPRGIHVAAPEHQSQLQTIDGCADFAAMLRLTAQHMRAWAVALWMNSLVLPASVKPETWSPEDRERFMTMPPIERDRWIGTSQALVCIVETYVGDALLHVQYSPEVLPVEVLHDPQHDGALSGFLTPLKGAGDA
jgi:hypothetical protein